MPRSPRILVADGTYHVTARGNNGEAIFRDDLDRSLYLQLLAKAVSVTMVRVLAHVLMTNHVHLVLQTAAPNLSDAIHRVNSAYAVRFNRRHVRTGHLFGSRYHGTLVVDDTQLLEATRYVHLNPVRAGVTRRPEDYPWSSYASYVRPRSEEGLVDPRPVLELLANNPRQARAAYEKFVLDAVPAMRDRIRGCVASPGSFGRY